MRLLGVSSSTRPPKLANLPMAASRTRLVRDQASARAMGRTSTQTRVRLRGSHRSRPSCDDLAMPVSAVDGSGAAVIADGVVAGLGDEPGRRPNLSRRAYTVVRVTPRRTAVREMFHCV